MGEWRKNDLPAIEGATSDHTAYEWQFGAEIDGVFVPAVTKSGGYIDSIVAAGKQAQEQAASQGSSTQTTEQTGQADQGSTTSASTPDGGSSGEGGEGGAA